MYIELFFLHQLNSKNNGPVLILKPSVATDDRKQFLFKQ